MENEITQNNFDLNMRLSTATGAQLKIPTCQGRCRLLRFAPLAFVIAGCFLTVVGHIASMKSCEISGPVVIGVGGLLLVFATFWSQSRQNPNPTEGGSTTSSGEVVVNIPQGLSAEECFNDELAAELGSIHHFEVWSPSLEPSDNQIVPPSYEEAVTKQSLQGSNAVNTESHQEFNLEQLTRDPPSYEQSCLNKYDVPSVFN